MALNDILTNQIASAFTNVLGKGGFTEDLTVKYQTGPGVYDVENDVLEPDYSNVDCKDIIVAKPGADDTKDANVLRTDAKLLFPGKDFQVPEPDTDLVVRANGEVWDIRKVVEVPGGSLVIVFIYRT